MNEIETLFPPCGTGYVVALRAYLDASIRESGVISVAGFAFGLKNAKKANNAWHKLFGNKICHMTDLHHNHGDFAGLSKEVTHDLCHKAFDILRKYSSYSVATSFNINEVEEHLPKQSSEILTCQKTMRGYENPYSICCHFTMHKLGRMVAANKNSKISYVFESGDHGQNALREYGSYVMNDNSRLSDIYRSDQITFADKKGRQLLLQSADILAWESALNIDRRKNGIGMRPSLRSLFGEKIYEEQHRFGFAYTNRKKNVWVHHLEGENLKSMMQFYQKLFRTENSHDLNALKSDFEKFFSTPF